MSGILHFGLSSPVLEFKDFSICFILLAVESALPLTIVPRRNPRELAIVDHTLGVSWEIKSVLV